MDEAVIDIKFVIVPEGFTHNRSFSPSLSLLEAKAQIEQDLRIPVANMKLVFNGQEMTSGLLRDFGFTPGETNQVCSKHFLCCSKSGVAGC